MCYFDVKCVISGNTVRHCSRIAPLLNHDGVSKLLIFQHSFYRRCIGLMNLQCLQIVHIILLFDVEVFLCQTRAVFTSNLAKNLMSHIRDPGTEGGISHVTYR